MELEGRVIKVLPATSGVSQQGNSWKRQDFVFGFYENPSDIYERNILLSIMNERIDQIKLEENLKIKVRIALSCHEYNGRYFNEIRTGDITIISRPQQQQEDKLQTTQQQQQQQQQGEKPDDLPF